VTEGEARVSRRRLVPAALLVALALTGCGTGLQNQTYKERSIRDFDGLTVGSLEVRNLGIDAPASGSVIPADEGTAVVTGSVINTGRTADALTGASSSVAASAQLQVDGTDVSAVPVPAGSDAGTTWAVLLTGLKKDLLAGTYVDITLTFERAGRTEQLSIPVRVGDTGLSDREEAQDPYEP
jgi:copper(I)-binding protein